MPSKEDIKRAFELLDIQTDEKRDAFVPPQDGTAIEESSIKEIHITHYTNMPAEEPAYADMG